jgi:hypothetical protein
VDNGPTVAVIADCTAAPARASKLRFILSHRHGSSEATILFRHSDKTE